MKFSFVPVAAVKRAWMFLRISAIRVTSTSTTVVSCADEIIDATARSASTLRSLDIGSLVPRSALTGVGTWAAEGADDVPTEAEPAAMTSSLRIRPPTPVPETRDRSIPES